MCDGIEVVYVYLFDVVDVFVDVWNVLIELVEGVGFIEIVV